MTNDQHFLIALLSLSVVAVASYAFGSNISYRSLGRGSSFYPEFILPYLLAKKFLYFQAVLALAFAFSGTAIYLLKVNTSLDGITRGFASALLICVLVSGTAFQGLYWNTTAARNKDSHSAIIGQALICVCSFLILLISLACMKVFWSTATSAPWTSATLLGSVLGSIVSFVAAFLFSRATRTRGTQRDADERLDFFEWESTSALKGFLYAVLIAAVMVLLAIVFGQFYVASEKNISSLPLYGIVASTLFAIVAGLALKKVLPRVSVPQIEVAWLLSIFNLLVPVAVVIGVATYVTRVDQVNTIGLVLAICWIVGVIPTSYLAGRLVNALPLSSDKYGNLTRFLDPALGYAVLISAAMVFIGICLQYSTNSDSTINLAGRNVQRIGVVVGAGSTLIVYLLARLAKYSHDRR